MIEIIKLSATEHIYKEMIDCILCSSIKPPPPSGGKGHVDTDRKNQRLKSLMNKITIVLYVLMFCLNWNILKQVYSLIVLVSTLGFCFLDLDCLVLFFKSKYYYSCYFAVCFYEQCTENYPLEHLTNRPFSMAWDRHSSILYSCEVILALINILSPWWKAREKLPTSYSRKLRSRCPN